MFGATPPATPCRLTGGRQSLRRSVNTSSRPCARWRAECGDDIYYPASFAPATATTIEARAATRAGSFLVLALRLLGRLAVILFVVVLFLTRRIIGMLMLVLVRSPATCWPRSRLAWRAFSRSASWSGAAVNVNISGSEICSPFFTLTSTSSGPCQTLMLTPVVSVPLVSSFDRLVLAGKHNHAMSMTKPDAADHQRKTLVPNPRRRRLDLTTAPARAAAACCA